MACKVEYVCMRSFGPLHHHNVRINGEEWHRIGRENPPLEEEEILEEIRGANCKEGLLETFNYEKGWIHDCP